ncbi:hypothetical protein QBC45DRAFT_459924 [Copromyces sp. CBS 386.78]|nr:hypothetical protein QBC45DRAFT_459924 [Copromyces sp. CBS 386.78]
MSATTWKDFEAEIATSGIGRATINKIISRGDKVIASGHNVDRRLGELNEEILKRKNIFGHIDVLFNNAGISSIKSVEEAEYTSLPFMGTYSASKAALSSYVESLHKEPRPLGIRCVSIECGGFPTNLGQPRLPEVYGPLLAKAGGMFISDLLKSMPGDLAIVDIVLTEEGVVGDKKKWVARVLLGSDAYESVVQKCEEMVQVAAEWKAVSFGRDREEAFDGKTDKRYLKLTSISLWRGNR